MRRFQLQRHQEVRKLEVEEEAEVAVSLPLHSLGVNVLSKPLLGHQDSDSR